MDYVAYIELEDGNVEQITIHGAVDAFDAGLRAAEIILSEHDQAYCLVDVRAVGQESDPNQDRIHKGEQT